MAGRDFGNHHDPGRRIDTPRTVGDEPVMHNRIRFRMTTTLPDAVLERLAMDCRAEVPGPDGIRRKLVARIKAEIAAGTYDTEERWLAAETRLLNQF